MVASEHPHGGQPDAKIVALGIDDFDATWASGPDDFIHDRVVIVSLEEVTYFRLESLPFLLGIFDERGSRKLETQIELPRSTRVIDWLRAWRLPEALFAVTGIEFEKLLTPKSRGRYARIVQKPSIYEEPVAVMEATSSDPHAPGLEILLPKGFFALTRLELQFDPEEAAWKLRYDWLDSHVQGVLGRYLKDDPEFLATDVIYEAVLNAATHAKAGIGFSACQMRRYTEGPLTGKPKDLEIVIWDNGLSFIDTLRAALSTPDGIQSASYPEEDVCMEVQLLEDSRFQDRTWLFSSSGDVDTSDHGLALSAFFKGITSSPLGSDRNSLSKLNRAQVWPTGDGLYQVREAVIDGYGGSIRYIAGRDRITLRAHPPARSIQEGVPQAEYLARVDRKGARSPWLPGNLLILRLPFRSGVTTSRASKPRRGTAR